jgi:hypothetical protein
MTDIVINKKCRLLTKCRGNLYCKMTLTGGKYTKKPLVKKLKNQIIKSMKPHSIRMRMDYSNIKNIKTYEI